MVSAQAKQLTDFIHNTHWDELPPAVKEQAIKCAIDLFGAALAGTITPIAKIGSTIAQQFYPGTDASILLTGRKASLVGAAFANGMAANALDVDDGLSIVKGHPGAVVFSALLATAQQKNVSIKEFLEALVVSYEIAIRMGLVLQKYYGFYHSSGAWGASGAAAGTARILGLSDIESLEALGIAEYNAPLTPVMRAVEIPSMNKDGIAWGSMTGMLSTLLAKAGATGRPSLLEMDEYNRLTATLGQEYEMLNLYFKPHCCCRWAHPAINAVIDLRNQYHFTEKTIRKVNIRTFRAATQLFQRIPNNTEEAQYNVAYPIAAAIVAGEVGPEQVMEGFFTNASVLDLMSKISLSEDSAFEEVFPQKRLCEVEIELNSGEVLRSGIYQPYGEVSDGINRAWIVNKFKKITNPVLSPAQADALIALLSDPEQPAKVEDLFRVIAVETKTE